MRAFWRRQGPVVAEPAIVAPTRSYEHLYEAQARVSGDDGVGGGDYDSIGEIELDVLREQGLRPGDTLLDFGCGNGRLAVHAVPYLAEGAYVGSDIAPTFLDQARARIARLGPTSCQVTLLHQQGLTFDLGDGAVDMACAYSVFTHMEHEDLYRHLQAFHRIVKPGGRFVISCLPLDLGDAQHIFRVEAELDVDARWQRVRNVTTSVDLVEAIVAMAGWRVDRWLPGTAGQATSRSGEVRGIGQSIVVLDH